MRRVILILLILVLGLCACAPAEEPLEAAEEPVQDLVSAASDAGEEDEDVQRRVALAYFTADALNPYTTENSYNQMLGGLIYEGLFSLNSDFSFTPCLCASYSTEDDVNWTFTVRSGVSFHSGRRLTAADVVYSLETSGVISGSVWAEDDYTVKISLYAANPRLPALLDAPVIPSGAAAYRNPSGTGPYSLGLTGAYLTRSAAYDDTVIPERIELYPVKTLGEVVAAYRLGNITIALSDPDYLSIAGFSAQSEYWSYPTSVMHYLILNTSSGHCSDQRLRYALSFAIDREGLTREVFAGEGTASVLPISPAAAGEEYDELAAAYAYSPENFAGAMESMFGLDENSDGFWDLQGWNVELDLIVNRESEQKCAAARSIAETLDSLGIIVHLYELDWADYREALNEQEFDVAYAEVRLRADFDLTPLLDGVLNYGGFSLGSSSASNYEYILSRAPIIPILFENRTVLVKRTAASGLNPSDGNIFNDFLDWDW